MAGFGYALGQAASSSTDIKWLPGDEFEPAQRKLREGSINGRALLADHPELHALRLEPVQYPLLAKRTRIMGSVIAMFVVARDGSVKNINFLSGHTLLRQAVAEAVSKWKFQELADGEVELTLTCDFGSSENWNFDRPAALITQPMHLTILVPPVMWNP